MNLRKADVSRLMALLFLACLCATGAQAAGRGTGGDSATIERWFAQYARAWEKRDASAATALFSTNAEYREDPFTAPLRGEKAIRAYWDDVAQGQRKVQVGYEILGAGGDTGIVRWTAGFTRIPSGQKVRLEGIAQINLDRNGRCVRFREWWNRQQN